MCGCLLVYPYLVGRLKIRIVLDQHLHRVHVPVLTRRNQRCPTVLPSQPASVRTSGAAAATVYVCGSEDECGCIHVCPCIICEIQQDHVRVFMCSTRLD